MLNQPQYITMDQLAEMLGISKSLIFKIQREGGDLPPCISLGPRCKRFKKESVMSWLEAKEKKCVADPKMQMLGGGGGRPSLKTPVRKGKTKKDRVEERMAGLKTQASGVS